MSFGFQFDDDELEDDYKTQARTVDQEEEIVSSSSRARASFSVRGKARKHSLEELLATLPSRISYSSISVTTIDGSCTMCRRDLFDARFQLLHDEPDAKDEEGKEQRAIEIDGFQAGTNSDLVPGVYEGGLKTWECSQDLVASLSDCLKKQGGPSWLCGKRVTEIGCGTALPSMYLFARKLTDEEAGGRDTCTFELCDFNEQVLRLVALPNLFLTWYFSSDDKCVPGGNGEIDITDDLLGDFQATLVRKKISLDFYSGHWDGLQDASAFQYQGRTGNVVLTSETIYSVESLPTLVDTLETACGQSIEASMQNAMLDNTGRQEKRRRPPYLCLVAAKVLYFGVGGGVNALKEELSRRHASSKDVWQSDQGVARTVMEILFDAREAKAGKER